MPCSTARRWSSLSLSRDRPRLPANRFAGGKADEPCPLNRFAYPGYLLHAATERDLPPSQRARRGDRGTAATGATSPGAVIRGAPTHNHGARPQDPAPLPPALPWVNLSNF